MYIGTMDQPNIFKCKIKGDNEYRGYQWGLRNPLIPINQQVIGDAA